jgi:hypothetical protein
MRSKWRAAELDPAGAGHAADMSRQQRTDTPVTGQTLESETPRLGSMVGLVRPRSQPPLGAEWEVRPTVAVVLDRRH